MSVYRIIINIVKILLYLVNGKPLVYGEKNLPKKASIIASTHRSFLDPVLIVMLFPKREVAFMAKKSLFEIPIIGYLIKKVNAFPINREKPSTNSLRRAVDVINKDENHLGIFPTGSRYATEVKSGTAFIQRMSKADIIPMAIQPPMTFKEIILRKKGKIAIGEPIHYNPDIKYTKDELNQIDKIIATEFDRLDKIINPKFVYQTPKKK